MAGLGTGRAIGDRPYEDQKSAARMGGALVYESAGAEFLRPIG